MCVMFWIHKGQFGLIFTHCDMHSKQNSWQQLPVFDLLINFPWQIEQISVSFSLLVSSIVAIFRSFSFVIGFLDPERKLVMLRDLFCFLFILFIFSSLKQNGVKSINVFGCRQNVSTWNFRFKCWNFGWKLETLFVSDLFVLIF